MQKNVNIKKIAFEVIQMKFLAMHITNQKWSFSIFTVIKSQFNIELLFQLRELVIKYLICSIKPY